MWPTRVVCRKPAARRSPASRPTPPGCLLPGCLNCQRDFCADTSAPTALGVAQVAPNAVGQCGGRVRLDDGWRGMWLSAKQKRTVWGWEFRDFSTVPGSKIQWCQANRHTRDSSVRMHAVFNPAKTASTYHTSLCVAEHYELKSHSLLLASPPQREICDVCKTTS
jgi:hypothetical protein